MKNVEMLKKGDIAILDNEEVVEITGVSKKHFRVKKSSGKRISYLHCRIKSDDRE
jgi:uncharacterized Zn finger protein